MNRFVILLSVLLAAVGILLPGCNDIDDNFSTNPDDRLSFSVDTLRFDTVFTTIGSATRQFMIYNTNKDPLNIESIRLLNASAGFRINVDGRSAESFSGIRILGKDSMYVFVEVTVDPTGQSGPILKEDQLEFTTNGNRQSVHLEAYGLDATVYRGGHVIDKDTAWTSERPFLIYDSLVVSKGATLTIGQGTVICMHNKAKWNILGAVRATGTVDEPVVFRGDRLDNLFTDLPYDRLSGQWDGLYFAADSYGNELDHVVVRGGTSGLSFEESTPGQLKLKLTNSQVTQMEKSALRAVNCQMEIGNTEFSNTRDTMIILAGGTYRFTHCTLANYYRNPSKGRKSGPALCFAPPLQEATFRNCIIDGSLSDEIGIDNPGDAELNYLFDHCAVRTAASDDDPHFNSVQFTSSSTPVVYKQIGDSENNYIYDFRLDIQTDADGNPAEDQIAVGQADADTAKEYPFDRLGVDRLNSADGPDTGAYEYMEEEKEEEE